MVVKRARFGQGPHEARDKSTGSTPPLLSSLPVMTFMVNHAATVINRIFVDQGGKTSMEKARGTIANRPMGEFGGGTIRFQPMTKYSKLGGSMGSSWE